MRRWPRAIGWGAAMLALGTLASAAQNVEFMDTTKAVGIAFTHANSATASKYLVETMGGGVALLDYDNDGRLDVFFTNGAKILDPMPPAGRPDKSEPMYWNRLYRQAADGTFTDVTEKAGVTGMPQNQYGMGVAVGDYDNDGHADLYVTSYGGNTLYRNTGRGTFDDVTVRAGVAAGGWSASAGFFDYDNDGHLNLFVTRYLAWSFRDNRHCGDKKPGYRAYATPTTSRGWPTCSSATTRTVPSPTSPPRRVSPTSTARVSAWPLPTTMTTGGWTSTWPTIRFRVPVPEQGRWHVRRGGSARGRRIERGRKDLCRYGRRLQRLRQRRPPRRHRHRSLEREVSTLRHNGDGSFRDATNTAGIGGATLAFSGWSTRFFDYDNDGWKDIFVAQGHVMDTIEKTSPNLRYLQPPLLLRNGADASCGSSPARPSSGLGGPRRSVRRPRQRRRPGRGRQQRRAAGDRAAQRRRQPPRLAAHRRPRHPLQPRRDRRSGEGRVGIRSRAALHRHDCDRLSLGERQAGARRARRRQGGPGRRDPLAVGGGPDVRQRGGGTDPDRHGAGGLAGRERGR